MSVEKQIQAQTGLRRIQTGVAVLGILFLSLIISRLVFPFGAGTWEAFNWMPATHILEGKNPYSYSFTPPYSMTPYGIFFYVLMAVGVKLFGFQIWFGRILSVLALAVCIYSAGKITKRITTNKEAFWFVHLAILAMFPLQIWIGFMRADLIAAAFGLTALQLVFGLDKENKVSVLKFAGIVFCAAAAFFTKQPYILPTAFVFLRFLQLKKWREGIVFALCILILTASVMFFLNYTSAGGFFWQHFTHAETLPYGFENSIRVFGEMLKQPSFSFSIIFTAIFVIWKSGKLRQIDRAEFFKLLSSPQILILFYILVTGLFSFFSSGREGGNANYYIENSFALAIGGAFIYDAFRRETAKKWAMAFVLLIALSGIFQIFRVLRGEYFRWQSLSYYQELFETTEKFIPPNGTCISINPELVVWNGCSFNFDDFEEYQGNWSPALRGIFEREINQGRYAVIIWYHDKLHLNFPNYRLVPMSQKPPERFYPAYLYVRKNGSE